MAQQIPKLRPAMIKAAPDQFCDILNKVITKVNKLPD